jgi:hypothetical protein
LMVKLEGKKIKIVNFQANFRQVLVNNK